MQNIPAVRRPLTPCLLTGNLPKTPLGEPELLGPLFRYLQGERERGAGCKFEAFFVLNQRVDALAPQRLKNLKSASNSPR